MVEKTNEKSHASLMTEELDAVENHIEALKKKLDVKPDYSLGVGDPRMTSWPIDLILLRQLERRVTSLKQALKRIDEGTYGICEQCGKQINPDRLAVLHDAKLCIDCARKDKT